MISVPVNETTADIHCVVCKDDSTSPGNEIVLCDSCSVGESSLCCLYVLYFFDCWFMVSLSFGQCTNKINRVTRLRVRMVQRVKEECSFHWVSIKQIRQSPSAMWQIDIK